MKAINWDLHLPETTAKGTEDGGEDGNATGREGGREENSDDDGTKWSGDESSFLLPEKLDI